jgi:hypothetical protein
MTKYTRQMVLHTTCSKTQVCTITQEALLSCIHNYGKTTSHPVTAHCAAQQQYPTNMLHAVLDKNHGPSHGNAAPPCEPQVQGIMGQILHKRTRASCSRHARSQQRHQHHCFHPLQKHSTQLQMQRHVRVCLCQLLPGEGGPQPHTRVTVGGNLLHHPGDCGAPTVDMTTVKLHLNSVISTKNARYCTIDVKDFYLNTPMDQPEYMRMKISNLPPNFVKA